MSATRKHAPLALDALHAVSAEVAHQTIAESNIECEINMGAFTIYHGTRYGAPIVIVEHHNQQADELSAIYFNDGEE